ncbi:MAG: NUDIX hydrolase, partial [Betaproteobacteria bacterium]|nr:NUDIX hydrolase [Betaproteobacteria bacterium]
ATLFTGDHLMGASTVVIGPPDGDMSAYLASLRALVPLALDWLAPGHGFLMAEPRRVIEGVIRHRLAREAKVMQALTELGPATAASLLARVYDDVRPALHPVALRSLTAHLIKLRRDGRAALEGEDWRALDAA